MAARIHEECAVDLSQLRPALKRVGLVLAALSLAASKSASAQTFTTIDVPNAFETRAHGINDREEIVGFYAVHSGDPFHGYLRTSQGSFFTIDVPGAFETRAQAINASGDIVGDYGDLGGTHGFLRKQDGAIVAIDVPGAALTVAFTINSQGDIGGVYFAGGIAHGFIRSDDGTFLTVDFPGASWTIGAGMNERGDVGGAYVDSAGFEHGYFRLARDGVFTSFDAPLPGGGTAVGTEAHYGNDHGQIVGPYCPVTSCLVPGEIHGYLRQKDGTFVLIDVPPEFGAVATAAGSINNAGSIVGDYITLSPVPTRHGFLRTP